MQFGYKQDSENGYRDQKFKEFLEIGEIAPKHEIGQAEDY